jgi:DNA-binding SARP family transcriptional activator
MGWCHEFGCQITSGCNHPMKAGASACTCSVCETVCEGRFSGCPDVFARSVPVAGPTAARTSGAAPPPTWPVFPTAGAGAPAPQPPASQVRSSPGQPPPRPVASRPSAPDEGSRPVPAPAGAGAAAARPQPGTFLSRENGTRILHWMRAEFEGVRSQLHAVASSLAHQQALVTDLANSRGGELNNALAELEGTATQLRTEASRMRRDAGGLQEDGAELRRESTRIRELEREMTERLPKVVADAVQPELRAALREVEAITAGLRDEASQLRSIRDGLTEQLPRLVDAAVRDALASYAPPGSPSTAGPAPAPAQSAPEANGFAADGALVGLGAPPSPAPGGAGGAGAGSPLADEPADDAAAPAAFGPPPAPEPVRLPADGGVGEDPLACTLPGLVVGPSLAVGVSDALRLAGLRRRRRRRPAKPTPGLHRRDPFASPVTRRLDRYARTRADLAAVRPAGRGNGKGPGPPSTVAVGFRDAEEVTLDLADGAGLSLAGPSAADAARFLVTSFLALAGTGGGRAVVVGDLLPPGQAFPGLRQPRDLGAALAELAVLEQPAGPDTAPRPTLVVARDAAPEELAALASLRHAGVLPVLVGAGPDGATTVRLGPGERVAEVSSESLAPRLVGARMYTLAREAASELLAVLASARTDDEVVAATVSEAEPFEVTVPAAPLVSVELLGTYRIDVGGVEIRAGLRAKARELLAFYLLHPAGATLDAAVEALWPDADPGRGSEWFWTALGNLRSRLRDATGEKKLKVIEREGDRYRVEPLFDVDLWRLEQALGDGAAEGDDFGRAAAYDRVAQAYAGDLLAGADWAWAETPREDLRQRVLDVLVWLGDIRWTSGDARGSWQALQRAVEVDPYAEQIYRRIMRLQSKLGRPDDAAVTFRRLQARLVEIDLEPTPESERLHAELCAAT